MLLQAGLKLASAVHEPSRHPFSLCDKMPTVGWCGRRRAVSETFRLTLEVELHSAATGALAGRPDTDLSQLRGVIEAYSGVVDATVWPESEQGEFLDFVTQDVGEFSTAMYAEAAVGRWNVAAALIRPLQERSEYALAGAIDPEFFATYRRRLDRQIESGFNDRSRLLVEEARGIIDRWAATLKGTDGLLETSRDLNRTGSELLHHGIGLSRVSADNDEVRRGLITMTHGRAQLALANVLLTIQILGAADTAAWRAARQVL